MPSSRKNRGSRHRSRHQKPKEDSPPYDDEDLRHGPLPETDYGSWEVEHLPIAAPPPLVEGPSVLEFEPPPAPSRAPKRKSSLQEPEKSSPPSHSTTTNHNNGPSKKKKGGAPPSLDRWDGGDEEPLPLFSSSSSHNPVAASGLDFRGFRADPIEFNSQIRQTTGKEFDRLEEGGGGVGGGGGGEGGDVDNRSRKSKARGQISSGSKSISTSGMPEDFVPTATDASAAVDNKTLRAKSKVSWHNKESSTANKPTMDREADVDKCEPNLSTHHHHHHHLKEKAVSASSETVKTNPRKSSSSSSASKRLDRDVMMHKGAEAELHPSSRRPPEESPYELERKRTKAIDASANSSSPKSGKREESHRQRKAEELQKPKTAEGSLKSFVRDDPVADERKSFAAESTKSGIGIESSIQDNHRNLELEKELENRIRRRKEESADRGRRKDDDTKEKEREGSSKRSQHQRVHHSRGEGRYREESKYREEKHRDDKEGLKERLKDEKLEVDSRNRDEKDGDDRYTLGEKVKESSLRHKERDNDDKDRGGSKRHHHQRESHQRVEKYREEVRHRDDKPREENRKEGKHKEERGKDERMVETDSRHSRDDRDNNRLLRHAEERHASEKEERQQQRKERDFDERRREASRRSPSQYRYEERAKEEVSHRDEKDADGRHGGDERGGGIGEEREESQKLMKDRDERRREALRRSPSNALKDARSKEDRPPPSKMRHLEERIDWMPHNNIHMSRPPHSNSMVRPQMGGISSHPSGPSSLLPPPPPLRPGIDNPAVLGNSSGYDDGGMGQRESGRYDRKSGGPYKRSELGGPPGPGDSWRGLRMGNWGQNQGGPGPNNMFPHFPPQMGVHPPPGAGFMGMGQQYSMPPGMFGPGGATHRFPIGDSGGGFPPHGHVLGWHRPREYEDVHHHSQVAMEGWDGRGPYGDDRQRFGPQEWDQGAIQRMNNRGWEQHPPQYGWHGHGMDLGRGFRASSQFHEGPFESPIGGVVVGGVGGETIEGGLKQVVLGDSTRPIKERSSVVDMQEMRELNRASSSPARAPPLDTNLSTRSSSSEGLIESKPRRRMMERVTALLLNLDVSAEMAGAGLYEEYLSRLPPAVQGKARAGSTSQGEADALLVSSDNDLEFEADPEAETLISDSQVYPLFLPPVQDSVFKVAIDVYHRPKQEGRTRESKFGSFLLPPAASLAGIPDKQNGIEARTNSPCGFQGQKDSEMCEGEDEKGEFCDIDYDEACKDALHCDSDPAKGLGPSRVCMEVVVAEASERVGSMEVGSLGEGGDGGDNLTDYEEVLHISVASNSVTGSGKEPVVVVAAATNAACVAVHNVTAGTIGMEGGVGDGLEDGTANVVVVVTSEKGILRSGSDVDPSGTNAESSLGGFSGCSLEKCEEAEERQGDYGGNPMNDSSEPFSPLRVQPSIGCEPQQGFGGVCMVEEALQVDGGGIIVGKKLVPHHSPCEESTH